MIHRPTTTDHLFVPGCFLAILPVPSTGAIVRVVVMHGRPGLLVGLFGRWLLPPPLALLSLLAALALSASPPSASSSESLPPAARSCKLANSADALMAGRLLLRRDCNPSPSWSCTSRDISAPTREQSSSPSPLVVKVSLLFPLRNSALGAAVWRGGVGEQGAACNP